MPENISASFQNLLNKRINENYRVKKHRNLTECFTILKFLIIFIIFITGCKIITLTINVKERVYKQYKKESYETVIYCFYSLFTFALIVQLIELYAVIFNHFCLTLVFTVIEFMIIILVILDNYHSNDHDEHYLIILWIIGILIFIVHLIILYKIKFCNKKQFRNNSIKNKELNSESSCCDQLYVEQDSCSYRNFLKQQESNYQNNNNNNNKTFNQQQFHNDFDHSNLDIPNIGDIKNNVVGEIEDDDDKTIIVKPEIVKFVNDENQIEDRRQQEMQDLLMKCKLKILDLEYEQSTNQLLLDKHKLENENNNKFINDDCNDLCGTNCSNTNCNNTNCNNTNCNNTNCNNTNQNSNQTSEFNSPKLSINDSSCSETCREVSKIIMNGMDLDYKYNCQE